jgi:predicted RNase H-like HicB family nuclease
MLQRYVFTSVVVETRNGLIGYVEELPGAQSQGATVEEVLERLREATEMTLRANRRFTAEPYKHARVAKRGVLILEPSVLSTPPARGEA